MLLVSRKKASYFVWVLIIYLISPSASSANIFDRIFGPKEYENYEECILDRMAGVTSNTAAGAINRACRSLFPYTPPQPLGQAVTPRVARIVLGDNPVSEWVGSTFRVTARNSADFRLTRVNIFYTYPNSSGRCSTEFRDFIRGPAGVRVSGSYLSGSIFVIDFVGFNNLLSEDRFCWRLYGTE
jgi:hypothetical protein